MILLRSPEAVYCEYIAQCLNIVYTIAHAGAVKRRPRSQSLHYGLAGSSKIFGLRCGYTMLQAHRTRRKLVSPIYDKIRSGLIRLSGPWHVADNVARALECVLSKQRDLCPSKGEVNTRVEKYQRQPDCALVEQEQRQQA